MFKLTKSQLKTILDKFVIPTSNAPKELYEEFRTKIIDVILDVQNEIITTFTESDEVVSDKLVNFFEQHKTEKYDINQTLISSAYLAIDVPIIIPIEVLATCSMLNKYLLVYVLTKLSELLTNEIISYIVFQAQNISMEDQILKDLMKKTDKNSLN